MPLDVDGDERALRNDFQPLPADVGQCGGDQLCAYATSLVCFGDERMRQDDRPVVLFIVDIGGMPSEVARVAAEGLGVGEVVSVQRSAGC